MRIANITSHIVDIGRANSIFVQVETDTGLVGTGETLLRRRDRTVAANLAEMGEFLVGRDPLAIEDIFERLYRDSFWTGGPLHAAGRSAIDIALWDIKGQFYGAPVYQLLGGSTRDGVLCYGHATGSTPEEVATAVKRLAAEGYRAAKIALPWFYGGAADERRRHLKETEYLPTAAFAEITAHVAAARAAAGPDFELMLDCHGRLDLGNATRLLREVADYGLLFVEEPLPPEAWPEYAELTARSPVPIAAGERLCSVYDARTFLAAHAVNIIQCDIVNCGGFTGARKIAALAEAHVIPYAPHNPNGPVATIASVHLMRAIPNALILETAAWPGDAGTFARLVDNPPVLSDGTLTVGERPGLGVSLNMDEVRARPAGHYGGSR